MEKTVSSCRRKTRSNKPQIEKRRRDRINCSLMQLKSIVLDATKKEAVRPSKLEKADILEMTVKYVKDLLRNGNPKKTIAPISSTTFVDGYGLCIQEISSYFESCSELNAQQRRAIVNHLKTAKSERTDPVKSKSATSGGNNAPTKAEFSDSEEEHALGSIISRDQFNVVDSHCCIALNERGVQLTKPSVPPNKNDVTFVIGLRTVSPMSKEILSFIPCFNISREEEAKTPNGTAKCTSNQATVADITRPRPEGDVANIEMLSDNREEKYEDKMSNQSPVLQVVEESPGIKPENCVTSVWRPW